MQHILTSPFVRLVRAGALAIRICGAVVTAPARADQPSTVGASHCAVGTANFVNNVASTRRRRQPYDGWFVREIWQQLLLADIRSHGVISRRVHDHRVSPPRIQTALQCHLGGEHLPTMGVSGVLHDGTAPSRESLRRGARDRPVCWRCVRGHADQVQQPARLPGPPCPTLAFASVVARTFSGRRLRLCMRLVDVIPQSVAPPGTGFVWVIQMVVAKAVARRSA